MDTRLNSQAVAAAVVVADGAAVAAVAGSGTAAAAHVVVVVAAAYGKTTYTISHLNLYQHFPGTTGLYLPSELGISLILRKLYSVLDLHTRFLKVSLREKKKGQLRRHEVSEN